MPKALDQKKDALVFLSVSYTTIHWACPNI